MYMHVCLFSEELQSTLYKMDPVGTMQRIKLIQNFSLSVTKILDMREEINNLYLQASRVSLRAEGQESPFPPRKLY